MARTTGRGGCINKPEQDNLKMRKIMRERKKRKQEKSKMKEERREMKEGRKKKKTERNRRSNEHSMLTYWRRNRMMKSRSGDESGQWRC
jgi:iron only hydrogenase large subunit-like protein